MSIDIKNIDHIADLARLEFDNEDKDKIGVELKVILGYVEKLKEVDIDGIEPTIQVFDMQNEFREDVIKPSLDRNTTLMNVSEKKNGCFSVPKVVE